MPSERLVAFERLPCRASRNVPAMAQPTLRFLLRAQPERIASLDGLRAIAVLAVFVCHAREPWLPGGGVGVTVFFVISGFVITRLLLRSAEQSPRIMLRSFYWNRFTRLMPAQMVMVGVTVAVLGVTDTHRDDINHAPLALLYVMNIFRAGQPTFEYAGGMLGHTWSLGVEEQFYLMWPLLLIVLVTRLRPARQTIAVLAVCGLVLFERVILVEVNPENYARIYNAPDTRFDQLLFGCALALFLSRGKPNHLVAFDQVSAVAAWPAVAVLCASALAVAEPARANFFNGAVQFTLSAVAAAILVAVAARQPQHLLSRLLAHPVLVFFGLISYSFYLWHYPVLFLVNESAPQVPGIASGFVLATAVATLSYWQIEKRFHRSSSWRSPVIGTTRAVSGGRGV